MTAHCYANEGVAHKQAVARGNIDGAYDGSMCLVRAREPDVAARFTLRRRCPINWRRRASPGVVAHCLPRRLYADASASIASDSINQLIESSNEIVD